MLERREGCIWLWKQEASRGREYPCWPIKGEQNSDNFRKRASEGKGLAGAKPQRWDSGKSEPSTHSQYCYSQSSLLHSLCFAHAPRLPGSSQHFHGIKCPLYADGFQIYTPAQSSPLASDLHFYLLNISILCSFKNESVLLKKMKQEISRNIICKNTKYF